MFLGQTIANEIRAAFPGAEELDVRLALRVCVREDRDLRSVIDIMSLALTDEDCRRIERLAAWVERYSKQVG